MVLPQLDIGMAVGAELLGKAQRCAVGVNGETSTTSEIHAHTDDVGRGNARLRDHSGDDGIQHLQIVLRILQCIIGGKLLTGGGQHLIHDGVRIIQHAIGHLAAILDIYQYSTAGQCAEINSYRIF